MPWPFLASAMARSVAPPASVGSARSGPSKDVTSPCLRDHNRGPTPALRLSPQSKFKTRHSRFSSPGRFLDLRGRKMISILLVVLVMPKDPSEWLALTEDQLVLRRCAYWRARVEQRASSGGAHVPHKGLHRRSAARPHGKSIPGRGRRCPRSSPNSARSTSRRTCSAAAGSAFPAAGPTLVSFAAPARRRARSWCRGASTSRTCTRRWSAPSRRSPASRSAR